jgi:hypothetical protein
MSRLGRRNTRVLDTYNIPCGAHSSAAEPFRSTLLPSRNPHPQQKTHLLGISRRWATKNRIGSQLTALTQLPRAREIAVGTRQATRTIGVLDRRSLHSLIHVKQNNSTTSLCQPSLAFVFSLHPIENPRCACARFANSSANARTIPSAFSAEAPTSPRKAFR